MITGDNIFIAVETGSRAGLVDRNEKIILLEGRKQPEFIKGKERKFHGVVLSRSSY